MRVRLADLVEHHNTNNFEHCRESLPFFSDNFIYKMRLQRTHVKITPFQCIRHDTFWPARAKAVGSDTNRRTLSRGGKFEQAEK